MKKYFHPKFFLIISVIIVLIVINTEFLNSHSNSIYKPDSTNKIDKKYDPFKKFKAKPSDYERYIRGYVYADKFGELRENPDTKVENVMYELKKAAKSKYKMQNETITELGPGGNSGFGNHNAEVSGRVTVIISHPLEDKTLYAGAASGGIYKSVDNGDSWISITGNMPYLSVQTIAIHPSSPNKIYIGLGDPIGVYGRGIYSTSDGGTANSVWTALGNTDSSPDFNNITQIILGKTDPNKIVVGAHFSVFTSNDGGENFQKITLPVPPISRNTPWDIEQLHNDDTYIVGLQGIGIIRTNDFFKTSQLVQAVPPQTRIEMSVYARDKGIAYAQVGSPPKGPIYATVDTGKTWFSLKYNPVNGGQDFYNQVMEIDPRDSSKVYMGWVNFYQGTVNLNDSTMLIKQKTDYFVNRERDFAYVHVDFHGLLLKYQNDRLNIWMGTDGGIFHSNDDLITASPKHKGMNTMLVYSTDKQSGKNVYSAGFQDNDVLLSQENPDKDKPWQFSTGFLGDGFYVVWNKDKPNEVYGSTQFGNFVRSTDAGKNYKSDKNVGEGAGFFSFLGNSSAAPGFLVFAGGSGTGTNVTVSHDFGGTWVNYGHTLDRPAQLGGFGSKSAVSHANPNIVWLGDRVEQGILLSKNAGESFKSTGLTGSNSILIAADLAGPFARLPVSGIATDPNSDSTVYVLGGRIGSAKILRSNDMGKNWENISSASSGYPNLATFSLIVMPWTKGEKTELWAGTSAGIFISRDNGKSWAHKTDFPNVQIYDMRIVDGQLVIGTHGRGVWKIESDDLKSFDNYPKSKNYFSPRFYLSKEERVTNSYEIKAYIKSSYDSLHFYLKVNALDTLMKITEKKQLTIGLKNLYKHFQTAETEVLNLKLRAFLGNWKSDFIKEQIVLKKPKVFDIAGSVKQNFDKDTSLNNFYIIGNKNQVRVFKEKGHKNAAFHSSHPINPKTTVRILLNKRIKVHQKNHFIEFDEINALGAKRFYGSYVRTRISKTGNTWHTIHESSNLDFREWYDFFIKNLNDSQTGVRGLIPSESLFRHRKISLISNKESGVKPGDEIFIDITIIANDPIPVYGWMMKNLKIQEEIPEGKVRFSLDLLQSPVLSDQAYVIMNSVGDSVHSIHGRVIINKDSSSFKLKTIAPGKRWTSDKLLMNNNKNVHIDLFVKGFKKDKETVNEKTDTISADLITYINTKTKRLALKKSYLDFEDNPDQMIMLSNYKSGKNIEIDGLYKTGEYLNIHSTRELKNTATISFSERYNGKLSIYRFENNKWIKVSDGHRTSVNKLGHYALFTDSKKQEKTIAVVKAFTLSQNYPNPFNPVTTIQYSIPIASHVQILIYNSLGQRVRTLNEGQKKAGSYSLNWAGKNDFGQRVSSGIYFYKMIAGSKVISKKMVLLK